MNTSQARTTSRPDRGRWFIAAMGTLLQVTLGTIYAWSFFQKPLMAYAGWSNQQVAWILSLAICFLGLAAAAGGILLPRFGPRPLAVSGIALYAAGWLLGGLALSIKSLPLLYLGLGIIGGIGLGLGYVTPVATAARWFPDRKGLVTGMVVMGFGLGALVLSKLVGPVLVDFFSAGDGHTAWPRVFYGIALALGIPGLLAAWSLKNPPTDYIPPGCTPPASAHGGNREYHLLPQDCIRSRQFALMFFLFFCNITAGIMFIGFQSPLLQDLLKASDPAKSSESLAAAGATLIGISSLFNGAGRFFWGGLSDRIGRTITFRLLLGSQIGVFAALIVVKSPLVFSILVCYVLLCYGGGFGTMPSFVLTVFGARVMAAVYGVILTAWSLAGIVGPQAAAFVKDAFPPAEAATYTFMIGAVVLAVGLAASFALTDEPFSTSITSRRL